jgi:hypothetical protein
LFIPSDVFIVPKLKTKSISRKKVWSLYKKNHVCRIEDEKLALISKINMIVN